MLLTVKVMVTVLKKLFVISGGFSKHILDFSCQMLQMKMNLICMKMNEQLKHVFYMNGFTLRLVWVQEKGSQIAGPIILQSFAQNYDNFDFDEFSGNLIRYYNANNLH